MQQSPKNLQLLSQLQYSASSTQTWLVSLYLHTDARISESPHASALHVGTAHSGWKHTVLVLVDVDVLVDVEVRVDVVVRVDVDVLVDVVVYAQQSADVQIPPTHCPIGAGVLRNIPTSQLTC